VPFDARLRGVLRGGVTDNDVDAMTRVRLKPELALEAKQMHKRERDQWFDAAGK
jgi:hypothetical protein